MPVFRLRPLPTIAGAIVHLILSAMWFNAPFLFANQWLAGIGKSAEQVAAEFSAGKILVALIVGLAVAFALDQALRWSKVRGLAAAALLGAGAGLLLAASNSAVRAVFAGDPTSLILIYGGHDMVSMALVAATLAVWRPPAD